MKIMKFTTMLALLLMVTANVFGEKTTIDGIIYEVITKAKEAKVIKYANNFKYKGDIVIPETIEYEGATYSVTSIEEESFYYCTDLTSITIPGSVTNIGRAAFMGCKGLTSLTIPGSVTNIGSQAFRECSSLTSFTIPGSVTTIKGDLFYGCSSLISVTIPSSVTSIGGQSFCYCSSLTSVTIPGSVTSIELLAFYGCSGLTSLTIQNGVASIGGSAFSGCSGLTQVAIPSSVTTIGDGAFFGCTNMTSVHISDLEAWCNIIFYNNPFQCAHHLFLNGEEIKDLVIPNSVKSIANYVFSGCSGLTSVTIPGSVTNIGYDAFAFCDGLTSVHISDLEAWCKTAFKNYYSNPLVYAHHLYLNGEEIKNMIIPNGVKSIVNYAFSECSDLTSVTIPGSVTAIGELAFMNCSGLTSLTIPGSVRYIGEQAFTGCSGLTTVTIGEGVERIRNYAFSGCSGLKAIIIPNSVSDIGWSAFKNCGGLTTITIGNGVKTIDSEAFANCPELTDVYCYAENVSAENENYLFTRSDAFKGSYIEYATLHVPTASIDAYRVTTPWSGFKYIVELDGTLVEDKNTLYIGDVEALQGAEVSLSVKMLNTMDIEGFAFDLVLPDGFIFVKDDDGKPMVSLSEMRNTAACMNSFTVVMLNNDVNDAVRVIAASTNGSAISPGDGEVCTVRLRMENGLKEGTYNVMLRNISIADTEAISHDMNEMTSTITVKALDLGDANGDGNLTVADLTAIAHYVMGNTPNGFSMTAADANQDGQVNVADFTAVAHLLLYGSIERPATGRAAASTDYTDIDNTVYIEPLSANAGEELAVSVKMRNNVEVEGFQFTLSLPEGTSVVLDTDEQPCASLSTERTTAQRMNTFMAALRDDNGLTVMAASTNGSTFSGTDGEVCQVRIRTAPDMAKGDYALLLSDVCISDTHARSHNVELLTTPFTISEASGLWEIVQGKSINANCFDLQGRRLSAPPAHGVYIKDKRRVVR